MPAWRHQSRVELPNGMQISCRRSCPCPRKSTLPLSGLKGRCAHWEPRPTPACQLHLRV